MTVAPLPTAAVADAALRLGVPLGFVAPDIRPLAPGSLVAGPAAPVTHLGSVDVILETIDDAPPGAVLVVDNGGRRDEACVGDLLALEAREAGLAAIVIWGLHRDTAQLRDLGIPVFSLGATPSGPRRVPPPGPAMRSAMLDGVRVLPGDLVCADDDGVLVVPGEAWPDVAASAAAIQRTELAQADRMAAGESLRDQLGFADYRARQAQDPTYSLRRHLAERGGAIET
jgi:regulator of RNase E activity RraA